MDRAFSPRIYHLRAKTWGGTRGWYQAAPLALGRGESREWTRMGGGVDGWALPDCAGRGKPLADGR